LISSDVEIKSGSASRSPRDAPRRVANPANVCGQRISHNGRPPLRSYPELVALRCLIVDDNPGFLHAASALLEQEGVRVVGVASTGAEAVRRAAELRLDVTLLDVDLGGESGFDVARQLVGDPLIDPDISSSSPLTPRTSSSI
jgi:PleD family two-component response regulator